MPAGDPFSSREHGLLDATIRRAEDVEDPTVSLRAVGREGVLCVALVDGLAYVVSASRS